MALPLFGIHTKTNKLAARDVQFTNARPQISRTKKQLIITTSEFSYYQFFLYVNNEARLR